MDKNLKFILLLLMALGVIFFALFVAAVLFYLGIL